MKPLAIDLYCGLGGWAEGFLAEDYRVVGFDIEKHDYGTGGYPGQLVIQDARTLHGSQFRNAAVIVASPPCTEYSYMAMPWQRAKQIAKALRGVGDFPEGYRGSRTMAELNALFDACFRIQREACEAAGRSIPLIVENVRGAQPWVGMAKANFGSYYLFGDIGMVGRRVVAGDLRFGISVSPVKATKVPGFRFDGSGGSFQTASVEAQKHNPDGTEHGSGSWFKVADSKNRGSKTPAGNCVPVLWKDREIARYAHPTPDEMEKHGFPAEGYKTSAMNWSNQELRGQDFTRIAGKQAIKIEGYSDPRRNGGKGAHLTSQRGNDARGIKQAGISGLRENGKGDAWLQDGAARHGSKSESRKEASAMIAKIPFALSQHIAKVFKPV